MAAEQTRQKRNDVLLIGSLMIFILLCFLFVWLKAGKEAQTVEISTDGKVTGTYSLSKDRNDIIITSAENGGTNSIVIQGGSVWVEEASCPDKVCVRQGAVSQTGQTIVCLPNKMIVTIK